MTQISRLLLCGLLAALALPTTASGSWTDAPRADSPAFASAASSEKKFTATLVVDVVQFQPNGCGAIAYFQFPVVRDATRYEVTYDDTVQGKGQVAIGPPFPQDGPTYGVGAPVPAGQHRLGITGGTSSGSEDCAGSEAGYRARLKFVSAKATLGERTCDGKPVPKGKALVEGTVTSTGSGSGSLVTPDNGVRVNVSGPTDAHPATDLSGYYCAIVSKGRYVLTPKHGQAKYTPPQLALSVTANRSGLDFRRETPLAVAKVLSIFGEQAFVRRGGSGPLTRLTVNDEVMVGDAIVTGAGTEVRIEFALGGRAVSSGNILLFTAERRASVTPNEPRRYVRGGMWAKVHNVKGPLEIQTNGGVMGIKG